ncbi:MAG: hypothetical protein ABEJ97_06705 [Halobellus sp.]
MSDETEETADADDTTDLPEDALAGAQDLRVAAVAAACTIALTLGLRYGLGRELPFVWRLVPLGPYFLSLFADRLVPGGLDTARNWSLLTVAVTLVAFAYFGFVGVG